jgi:hypothetical protein
VTRFALAVALALASGCLSKEDKVELDQLDRALGNVDAARSGKSVETTIWVDCSHAAERAARYRRIPVRGIDLKVDQYLDGCGSAVPLTVVRLVLLAGDGRRCEDALEATGELADQQRALNQELLGRVQALCCGPKSHIVGAAPLCNALPRAEERRP